MSSVTKVTLTNRTARLVGSYDFDAFSTLLRYRKPGWEYTYAGLAYLSWMEAVRKGEVDKDDEPQGWDGYVTMLELNEMGAGLFLALRKDLEASATTAFQVKDERRPPDFTRTVDDIFDENSREYQYECVKAMVANSKTGGLVLNATGTGKTYIAGKYLSILKGQGLFLVDELTLLDQAQKELSKVIGEPVGNVGNSLFNPKRITVATIQTMHRHRENPKFQVWTDKLECIFIDELHTALNRSNFQTVACIRPPVVFGLTATLELKKKSVALRAYALCGPSIFEYPLQKGVEEGYLSKGVAIAVLVNTEFKPIPIRGNPKWKWVRMRYMKQYQELYKAIVTDNEFRNGIIADFIQEAYERGKYIILLLERVQHLKDMSFNLDRRKIPHNLVFGEKRASERIESKVAFEKGKLRVILTNKVFKKGVDIKRVDLIIDGAGMKSKNDAVQKYGRGVRLCDEKDGLIYLDISDIGNRFERAAKGRRAALKRIGVPTYKVSSEKGCKAILDLAEARLSALKGGKKP